MTLTTLISNAEMLQSAMDRGIFLQVVLNDRREDILHEQQVQLLEGKDSDGNDMRPYYSEDLKPEGWFHSKECHALCSVEKDGYQLPCRCTAQHRCA